VRTQKEALDWARSLGLRVNPDNQVVRGMDALQALCERWEKRWGDLRTARTGS
jgi:NAD-dependent DNA ligase